jgi:two-component system sensor histidine kinase DctS
MTSGLAHELRQPLAAIHNYAEGSLRRLSRQGDPAEVSGALDHILEQAGRASDIVSRVRGYMRKRTPKHEPVDLNHAIHEACGFMHHDLEVAGINVDLDLVDGLPAVTGDLIELEQLIINICRNALDALGEAPAPRTIAVRSTVADGAVEVVIEDNGPGLADRDIDAVWEPFVTHKARGLGLGLAICRSIVEAHGGVIRARNRESGGFSVVFAIPTAEQESRHGA